MEISVGHTPDSDDAFMFYGMFTGKVQSTDFEVNHVIEDIEKLNRKATDPQLDVTAVSVHACAYIPGYTILRSGGSFGIGYGPIVTARKQMSIDEIKKCKIAIPGKMTSAFLLLELMIGKFDYIEMNFSDIPKAVKNGDVDVGLVIHETQLSFEQEGNIKILDVGEWWDKTTNGLPVPLGINVMRTELGMEIICKFDKHLLRSQSEFFDESVDFVDKQNWLYSFFKCHSCHSLSLSHNAFYCVTYYYCTVNCPKATNYPSTKIYMSGGVNHVNDVFFAFLRKV